MPRIFANRPLCSFLPPCVGGFLANIHSMPDIPKPNMPKPVLVIGSVLRPVDDHRMYEKLGVHIAASGVFQVHIVGFCSVKNVRHRTIMFHPLFSFGRLSFARFLSPLAFLKKLFQLKPETVVINSPDLLIVTIAYKILFGKKMFYDVLENYAANIMFANTYPLFVRRPLASFVRAVESVTRPFVDGYWLAERAYVDELPFVKGKYTIIENRFVPLSDVVVRPRRGKHRLLYSGTVGESYGVFDAIALAKGLHAIDNRFHLTIIGHAAQVSVRRRVFAECAGCDFIELVGINAFVPHSQILTKMQQCDVALLPYRVNQAIRCRTPTKVYEYAASGIPMIMSFNPYWKTSLEAYNGLIRYVDFRNIKFEHILAVIDVLSQGYNNHISLDTTYYTYKFSNLTEKYY